MPIPIRVRIPDTVESAIPSTSAISGPVNRSRRSAAIAWTRSLGGAVGDRWRRRGAIEQPELALGAVAAHPLARAADADFGGLGRLRQRPLSLDHPPAEQPALVQAEGRVSVQLHPVSSLGLSGLAALSLQGGPDEPTSSGTTPRTRAPAGPGPARRRGTSCARAARRRRTRSPARRPRARASRTRPGVQ